MARSNLKYVSPFLFWAFSLLVLVVHCSTKTITTNELPVIAFEEGYTQLFGDDNLIIHKDGKSVHLSLNERTGSGFVSHDLYLHGLFSASIKLPSDYTAGVVVAFYMSNGDMYEKNHDEIDFEFLGNIRGRDWRIQTNIYGNGSTSVGREERYNLWFDPSEDFHHYTILWTDSQIIFSVDDVPIREVKRTESMGGDFPSKPMSLYATIWDGSEWATNGGKYKVSYKYAPFVARFSNLVLDGCAVDPTAAAETASCVSFSSRAEVVRAKMEAFRRKHMTYSYCYDRTRYGARPEECVFDPREAERLRSFDPVTFGNGRRGRHHNAKRSSRRRDSLAHMAI